MNYQSIYNHLQAGGFAAYSPGQHRGRCTSPYVVLRNAGSADTYSMTGTEYELLLYYPEERYSELEDFVLSVQRWMTRLYPALRLIDGPGPHYLDGDVAGYLVSLLYQSWRPAAANRTERK